MNLIAKNFKTWILGSPAWVLALHLLFDQLGVGSYLLYICILPGVYLCIIIYNTIYLVCDQLGGIALIPVVDESMGGWHRADVEQLTP